MSNVDWSKAPQWATRLMRNIAPNETPNCWADEDGKALWITDSADKIFSIVEQCWMLIERRPAWSGEGLPPVGTVCEVYHCDEWLQGEVIAHFQQRAGIVAAYTVEVGSIGSGIKHLDSAIGECFRPIRTPEQIAAEEREKAIADIGNLLNCLWASEQEAAAFIYDAGYRKVKP